MNLVGSLLGAGDYQLELNDLYNKMKWKQNLSQLFHAQNTNQSKLNHPFDKTNSKIEQVKYICILFKIA